MTDLAVESAASAEADRLWAERFWTAHYRAGVPARIDDELARWTSVQQMFEADSRRFAGRLGYVSWPAPIG